LSVRKVSLPSDENHFGNVSLINKLSRIKKVIMNKKKELRVVLFMMILLLFCSALLAQQNGDASELISEEIVAEKNGFLATFVRTPFVLFCFLGTTTGAIFSALIEFIHNIFCGFDFGYPNTNVIWDLGWNQILTNWYWKPSVGWHVILSVIVWSPLLRRKKSKD
jgi:hypothetical protein